MAAPPILTPERWELYEAAIAIGKAGQCSEASKVGVVRICESPQVVIGEERVGREEREGEKKTQFSRAGRI